DKNAAMAAYGAEVVEHGKDFDEARQLVDQYVQREGLRSVHAATEPLLINGVGTYSLEILEDLPEIDAVIVPVGGGSGICGAVTVFRALKPGVKIIGVQAENAPCVYRSWMKGELVTTETADTFADGLATRIPFELPFSIMREGVDQMVLVSEEEIRQAILTLLHTTHNLAEGAGATALAGAVKIADELSAKKVAIVLSGGNIDMKTLRWVLSSGPGSRGD
ncbi:pyridoxal-phosphate dependent enzyme, partial [Candidatus Sumerlaeota bacterium]|nr:pyridoxal-phosphate dependent enzyme [Candidatus Sumerlaeota bacterium]